MTSLRLITLILLCGLQAHAQLSDSVFINLLDKGYDSPDSGNFYYDSAKRSAVGDFQQGLYYYHQLYQYVNNQQPDSANWAGDLALGYFKPAEKDQYSLKVYHKLMMYNIDAGTLETSLRYNTHALDLLQANNDTLQIVHYLGDRAIIYHDFESYTLGVKTGKEGLALINHYSSPEPYDFLHIMNTIAINYDDWGKGDSALYYYYQILEKYEGLPIDADVSRIYNNMGNTLQKQDKLTESKAYLSKAYNYDLTQDNSYELSTSANNMGTIHRRLGNYDSARYYLEIANVHADSSQSIEKKRDVYYQWSQYYAGVNDSKNAMTYQDKYYAMKDSIFKMDRAKVIADMETKYEVGKKNQEIQLLNKENETQKAVNQRNTIIILALGITVLLLILIFYLWRQRSRARQERVLQEQKLRMREAQINATIQSEEKERKRFAADLHDSMGQLVSALSMNVQSLKTNNSDKAVRDEIVENSTALLSDIQKEIRNIAFNLMPPVLTKEGLLAAISELILRINKSHSVKAKLTTFGLEKRMNEVYEISLYRILQEWISNILKYSDATNITIDFTEHEQEVVITVEDNGQGFDLAKFENSQGNGWRNINSRLNLIKAEMDIDTSPNRKNTTFILNFDKEQAFTEHQVEQIPSVRY